MGNSNREYDAPPKQLLDESADVRERFHVLKVREPMRPDDRIEMFLCLEHMWVGRHRQEKGVDSRQRLGFDKGSASSVRQIIVL